MSIVDTFFLNNYTRMADEEGWNIFESDNGLQIERCDESSIFISDLEALKHVVNKSLEGSNLHSIALECIKFSNKEEYNFIIEHTRILKSVKYF
jgi:hypothetical protein